MTEVQSCKTNKILTQKYTERPVTIVLIIKSASSKKNSHFERWRLRLI